MRTKRLELKQRDEEFWKNSSPEKVPIEEMTEEQKIKYLEGKVEERIFKLGLFKNAR